MERARVAADRARPAARALGGSSRRPARAWSRRMSWPSSHDGNRARVDKMLKAREPGSVTEFVAQRHAGAGHRRSPPPPQRAARGARRAVGEGRLFTFRSVRVLHRARRRQGGRQLQPRRWSGSRARRSPRSKGIDARAARPHGRRVRVDRRAAVRVLHARHPRAHRVAAREEGRGARPRHRGPPPRRAPLPVHRAT